MRISLVRILLPLLFITGPTTWAQDDKFDTELLESEEGLPPEMPEESFAAPEEVRPPQPSSAFESSPSTSASEPTESVPGSFRKPKGPPGGGTLKVPHPNAARGLLKIDKEGAYIYRTPLPAKSRSSSFRVAYQSSPVISNAQGVTFGDIYGSDGLVGLLGEYEWQPFHGFGALGFQLGSGLVIARGNGRFANGDVAEEVYTLYVVPLSALVVYRFEYVRRQWAVPFISGGATAYGMVESRDDGNQAKVAVSPAVVGGAGIHFNLSRWDPQGSFLLAQDYDVADLWLTVEAKYVQGLDQELDMSNQTVSAGFTVDF